MCGCVSVCFSVSSGFNECFAVLFFVCVLRVSARAWFDLFARNTSSKPASVHALWLLIATMVCACTQRLAKKTIWSHPHA